MCCEDYQCIRCTVLTPCCRVAVRRCCRVRLCNTGEQSRGWSQGFMVVLGARSSATFCIGFYRGHLTQHCHCWLYLTMNVWISRWFGRYTRQFKNIWILDVRIRYLRYAYVFCFFILKFNHEYWYVQVLCVSTVLPQPRPLSASDGEIIAATKGFVGNPLYRWDSRSLVIYVKFSWDCVRRIPFFLKDFSELWEDVVYSLNCYHLLNMFHP